MKNAPDFAQQLDPGGFKVSNTQGMTDELNAADQNIKGLGYDWSNINSLLGQVDSAQKGADAQAAGQDQLAGREAQLSQQDLGASGNDPQSIGKALMALGSKLSAKQAATAADAQEQQVVGANVEAERLRQEHAAATISMYSKELAMQNTKAQMSESVKQMSQGLALANAQLRNMYNKAVASAKNAKELGDIQVQHDQFQQIMTYVGMGLGAASSAAAAGAGALAPSAADMSLAQTYDAGSAAMTANEGLKIDNIYSAANNLSTFYGKDIPAGNGQGGY